MSTKYRSSKMRIKQILSMCLIFPIMTLSFPVVQSPTIYSETVSESQTVEQASIITEETTSTTQTTATEAITTKISVTTVSSEPIEATTTTVLETTTETQESKNTITTTSAKAIASTVTTTKQETVAKETIAEPATEVVQTQTTVTTTVAIAEDNNQNDATLSAATQEDIRLVALAIQYESDGSSEDSYGVASVVMNRVYSDCFPNTVRDVLTQPYQYSWVTTSALAETPADWAVEIATDVVLNGSTMPSNVVFQAPFKQGTGVYQVIGVHYYCYL